MARDITFDIIARDRASRVFSTVGTASQEMGNKVGHAGSIATAALGGLAVGGVIALGGLGVAGLKMGIETAAGMENAKIGFTTMLGSATQADAFLKQLASFAATTPFEFPELQTAASSLISAGIQADKVIPIMTTLGNVTSGVGTGSEGVKRATIAIQQMTAAGKIQAQDLNQLRDAGIPVYDLLASAMHKTKEEVAGLAQNGKLGKDALSQMMHALESGQGLERFSGLMDKQSQSLSGLWSTFHDTLNMGLAQAIQPLIPLLKEGLGGASAFLAGLMPKLADGFMTVMSGAKSLSGVFDNVKYAFSVLTDALQGYESDTDPWVKPIMQAGLVIHDVFTQVVAFFRGTLWPAIQQVAGIFMTTLVPAMLAAARFVTSSLIPAIMTLAKQVLPPLIAAFRTVATFISANVIPVVMALAAFFVEHVIPAISKVAVAILSGLKTAFETIQKTISEHRTELATLGKALQKVGAFITDKVVPILAVILKAAFVVVGEAISAAIVIISGMVTGFQTLGRWGTWLWENALRPAITFIIGGFTAVALSFAGLLEALSHVPGFGWAKDAADKMRGAAQAAQAVADNINAIPDHKQVSILTVFKTQGAPPPGSMAAMLAPPPKARAIGGPVAAGTPYMVGELGPEMFVPSGSGSIMTASATRSLLASHAGSAPSGPSIFHLYDADGMLMGTMRAHASAAVESAAQSQNMAFRGGR